MPICRLAKLQILLTEFDFVYVTRTAMKSQSLVNDMAQNLIDDKYEPLNTYFPNKQINSIEEEIHDNDPMWKLYFDGVVIKNAVRTGAVLISLNECHYRATT